MGAVRNRPLAAVLLGAALVLTILSALPNACHEDDEGCKSNPQHHATLNCGCSCHMPTVLPASLLALQLTAERSGADASTTAVPDVVLSCPVPPPRG